MARHARPEPSQNPDSQNQQTPGGPQYGQQPAGSPYGQPAHSYQGEPLIAGHPGQTPRRSAAAPAPAVVPAAEAAVVTTENKKRRKKGGWFFTLIGGVGEILITLGVVCFLFFIYESYWTGIESGKAQAEMRKQLEDQWSGAVGDGIGGDGSPIGKIYIPSFGRDWQYTVVNGTSLDDLDKGPGWYPTSQHAGEKGNFAIAGHRVGHGSPFNDLGYLNTCDDVLIETKETWFVYKVLPIDEQGTERAAAASSCMNPTMAQQATSGKYASVKGRSITTPGDVSVIAPVPNDRMSTLEDAELPILTLTTCHPQFSNAERMIIHAVLVRQEPRVAGQVPAELSEA